MLDERNYLKPERHASAGLPVGILLILVFALLAYLLVESELGGKKPSAPIVYLPMVSEQSR
ncbi:MULTISPECIES: hypothetical protein [unclassified Ensifer]|uniref:hypothetical protein n=1 Tax=unclassified Ensifer TaxID=2633371 RepID=UPI00081300B3|nr:MULTISPECIES: hypothetical protein [unclassified Ensifer]OCP24838.1 hypothetical protein BC361_19740 [Ensifer sp. LC54]OCP25823.1 hypothetical protein BC363_18795 [Ensifer sp. LC384]